MGVLVFAHSECLVFVYLLAFAHQWVADRPIPGVLDGAVEEGGSLALDRDVRRHISKHRNLLTVPGNADAITLSTSQLSNPDGKSLHFVEVGVFYWILGCNSPCTSRFWKYRIWLFDILLKLPEQRVHQIDILFNALQGFYEPIFPRSTLLRSNTVFDRIGATNIF